MISTAHELTLDLAARFSALTAVEAVALGGSRGTGLMDEASDIDLYVFTRGTVPLDERAAIVTATGGASRADLGLNYWGPGDEWLHAPSGIEVDIVYFDSAWMEDQIARVVDRHEASQGYTTCFWHTLRQCQPLADHGGWLARLRERCAVDYPDPLRRNIVKLNHPLLRGIIPAYAHQIEKAVRRRDLVSVNHRLAALLASYFDILFAVNRRLHPGEKRLVAHALRDCPVLPEGFASDVDALLMAGDRSGIVDRLSVLLDRLEVVLRREMPADFAVPLDAHSQ